MITSSTCPHCRPALVYLNNSAQKVLDVIDVELDSGQTFKIVCVKERNDETTQIPARRHQVPALQKDVQKNRRSKVPVLQEASR